MGLLGPVRVDSPGAWLVSLGCFTILFMNIGVARSLPFFFYDWVVNLETDFQQVGWVPSSAFACVTLWAPVSPILMRFLDQRAVIALGGCISAVAFLISSVVTNVGALIGLMVVAYLGAALSLTTGCIAVAMATNKIRPLATGLGNIGSPVAGLVLPYLLNAARESGGGFPIGWPRGMQALGGMFFLIPLISIFMRPPESEKDKNANTEYVQDDGDLEKAKEAPAPKGALIFCGGLIDLTIFKNYVFQLLCFYMTFHFGAFTAAYIFAAPYISQNAAETATSLQNVASLVNTTITNGSLPLCASCPVTMINATENGPSPVTSTLNIMAGGDLVGMFFFSFCMNLPMDIVSENRFFFFILNECVNIVAAALIPFSASYETLSIALFFTGFHYGGWFVTFWTVIADMFGKDMGPASSWALFVGGVSGLAIPNILTTIMKTVQDSTDVASYDYRVIWWGMAICQGMALLFLIIIFADMQRKRRLTVAKMIRKMYGKQHRADQLNPNTFNI